MTLSPSLSSIKSPNLPLVDWLESIDPKRRLEVFQDIGIQQKRHGVPNKKITKSYLQLADTSLVVLHKLSDDTILLYSGSASRLKGPVSEDEDEYYLCETDDEESCDAENQNHEHQENNKDKHLNSLSVSENEFNESNEVNRSTIPDPTQNTIDDFNPEGNHSVSKEDNNEVIDKSLNEKTDEREDINIQDTGATKLIDSLNVKNNVNNSIIKERKTVIEKSPRPSLQNCDTPIDSNCIKIVNLNKIKKQLNDQLNEPSNKQSEKELDLQKNPKVPLNDQERLNDCSKGGKSLSVAEELQSSAAEVTQTNNKEYYQSMIILKDQLEKNLKNKNVHLPKCSTTNLPTLINNGNTICGQPGSENSNVTGEKPSMSSRENLLKNYSDKTLNNSDFNDSTLIGNPNVVSNSDILIKNRSKEAHFSGCSSHKEKKSKSKPVAPPGTQEFLKEFNAELQNIKKIAESKKRLSLDSGENGTVQKKRRFSDQGTNSQNAQKQGTMLGNYPQSKSTLNTNHLITQSHLAVNTCQSQILKNTMANSETSTTKPKAVNHVVVSESNDPSVTVCQNNKNKNDITLRSLLDDSAHVVRHNAVIDANVGDKALDKNSFQEEIPQSFKVPLTVQLKTGQKSNTGKSQNQTISNLRRQSSDSAKTMDDRPSFENHLTPPLNIATEVINSVTEADIVPEKSINVTSHVKGDSGVAMNKTGTFSSSSNVNKQGLKSLAVSSDQNPSHHPIAGLSVPEQTQIAPNTQTIPPSNTSTKPNMPKHSSIERTKETNLVESASQLFLSYFSNSLDENLDALPTLVRSTLSQYCIYIKRLPFTKVTEFLKLYMICYLRTFNDEDLRKKTSKIAELLHLSIGDKQWRDRRRNQAILLQTPVLREGEINHADKAYDEILTHRGEQFAEMFHSVCPKISNVKGCEYMMLMTFYFKTIQALIKIDVENEREIFKVRDLMYQLLQKSPQNFQPFENHAFFKVDEENLKSNCTFVKQCLLTLYLSGHHESETENFFNLVHTQPTIQNLDQIINGLGLLSSPSTQTLGLNPTSSKNVMSQMPNSNLGSYRVHTQQQINRQMPINAQQINNETSSRPSQFMNQTVNSRNIPTLQHRTPNVQQRQELTQMIRMRVPSQLPPFASLNHPSVLSQQLLQNNQLASSSAQVNQGFHQPLNRLPQQYAQVRSYYRPPPPYPGGRGGSGTSQQWQQRTSSDSRTVPINIQVPANTPRQIGPVNLQNPNVSSLDEGVTRPETQKCWVVGCPKLATLVCSRCHIAVYCSTDCQTKDWYKKHSRICLE